MPKGSAELTNARREEIFLALFAQEYELFTEDLDRLCKQNESLALDELSSALAHALERRPLMLKLLSMNLYDMEANSRMERLVEFKAAYGESSAGLDRCLRKFVPALSAESRRAFLLGILVTVFCFRLKKWMSEKDRRDF